MNKAEDLDRLYEDLYWASNERAPLIQAEIRRILSEKSQPVKT